MSEYALEMLGISKSFPGVKCLDGVDLRVRRGEVHALIGENGAGKSSLMKVLSGVYKEDEGQIFIDGEMVNLRKPQDAIDKGVAIIYQEFNLAGDLSALQNVLLGHERAKRGWINLKKEEEIAGKWLDYVCQGGLPSYKWPAKRYTVAQQQMIEIAKALSLQARIIIMDEPTAALSDKETKILFEIISRLKADGVTILYISHRLEEIFAICDSITILRDGKFVERAETADVDKDWLISRMIGREMSNTFPERTREPGGEVVLSVKDLSAAKFSDVSFDLHKGEILGFSGLVGSGRTEVMRALFGADRVRAGTVEMEGKALPCTHPYFAVRAGIGFATEDRKAQGLFLGQSIKGNISLANLININRFGFIEGRRETEIARRYMRDLRVVCTGMDQLCKNLSGGNQQKVVLSKWLATQCRILILDEPTRGIDVGAKYEIYTLMNQLTDAGISILMVSSELPEVIAMSDRIVVMHEGRVTGVVDRGDATEELIMTYATGSAESEEPVGA